MVSAQFVDRTAAANQHYSSSSPNQTPSSVVEPAKTQHHFANMDAFTPQQTVELISRIAVKKANMRLDKLFINSVMAGPILGFA
jgi:hypothetical protein